MKVVNKRVINQQIIGDNATGYLITGGNITGSKEIKAIKDIIEKNCTQQEQEALLPVVSELCESINAGNEKAKRITVWKERLNYALLRVTDFATISTAAWWPLLSSAIENLLHDL